MRPSGTHNLFQYLGSAIAYLLPLLQILLVTLPENSKRIVLFNDYFLLVSIVTAVVAYIFILVVRSKVYFQFTLTPWRKQAYNQYLARTDPQIFYAEQIQDHITKNEFPKTPFYIRSDNAYLVFLPILVFSFLGFFLLGLYGSEYVSDANGQLDYANVPSIMLFFQAILYILFASFTVLQIAIHYVADSVRQERLNVQKERYNKILMMMFENHSINEVPKISFFAQRELRTTNLHTDLLTVVEVEGAYYGAFSDVDANYLHEVNRFSSYEEMIGAYRNNQPWQ